MWDLRPTSTLEFDILKRAEQWSSKFTGARQPSIFLRDWAINVKLRRDVSVFILRHVEHSSPVL